MADRNGKAAVAVTKETPSEEATRVGEAQRAFQEIRLAVPRQEQLVIAMEQLRVSALGRKPGDGTRGLRVIQPSGSGKSDPPSSARPSLRGSQGATPRNHRCCT